MKHHKNTKLDRTLRIALFSCTAIVIATAGMAGVPTIDTSSLSQLKNFVSNGQAQNIELKQIKDLEQQQLDAMGQAGPKGSLAGGSGLSNLGSSSDFYASMQKFAFDPCAVNLCQGGNNPVGTTDIEEAREWAMKNFFAGDIINPSTERDLREIRRRGIVNASVDGLALATITHNDLAGSGAQADALDQVVAASQDFRGDLRANSAIALATYKIEIQKLAMLTSLVEIQAMANINNVDIYHEEGGSSFADAHNEDDYAVNSPTTRIKVTPPNQGSAGGSGLGGALTNALGGGSVASILASAGFPSAATLPTSLPSLAEAVKTGQLPGIAPENMTMNTVVADAASVVKAALPKGTPPELDSSMSMVKNGLAKGDEDGKSTAMMGLATSFAVTGGNKILAAALNTGSLAMQAGTPAAATSFAKGVMRDLKQNGISGQYSDFLNTSISEVESGTKSPKALVLDSSAIFASLGSDANAKSASILQVDPAAVGGDFFKSSMADAMDEISVFIANPDIATVSGGLRRTTEADVSAMRTAFENASTQPAETAAPAGQNVFE